MARRDAPKRQTKRPKKKDEKKPALPSALFSTAQVEVVGKRRKAPKEESSTP